MRMTDLMAENVRRLIKEAVRVLDASGVPVTLDGIERVIRTAPRNDRDIVGDTIKSWCLGLLEKAHDKGADVERQAHYFIDRLPNFHAETRRLMEEAAIGALHGLAGLFNRAIGRRRAG